MRLPNFDGLNEAQRALYDHDIKEYYASPGDLHGEAYRRRFKLMYDSILTNLHRGARILDVGVAQGNLSLMLSEVGYDVTATDLRSDYLDYAKQKYESGVITFLTGSFEDLDFDSEFDVVILGELVEHVAYPEELLQRCFNYLKPSGLLLLSTPNGRAAMSGLPTFSAITDRKELEKHQFKPDGDGHLFLFTEAELRDVLVDIGFSPEQFFYWGSPLLSGKFKVRYLARLLPWLIVDMLDRVVVACPVLNKFFSAGLVCISKKS